MTRGAAVLPVDEKSCCGVACRSLFQTLPIQLLHVCHYPPHLYFGSIECARHFRVGKAIADDEEDFAVRVAVAKLARVQCGTASAFAILAVTVTTLTNVHLASGFQVRCRGIRVCFREVGSRLSRRSLRLQDKRATHQTVGNQKY